MFYVYYVKAGGLLRHGVRIFSAGCVLVLWMVGYVAGFVLY